MDVSGITLSFFQKKFFFFFYERRRTALGWGGSTKNMEKDDKSYSPRGLRHCFVFVFLVYTLPTVHCSLSDLKLDVYVFFVDWFLGSKRVYLT